MFLVWDTFQTFIRVEGTSLNLELMNGRRSETYTVTHIYFNFYTDAKYSHMHYIHWNYKIEHDCLEKAIKDFHNFRLKQNGIPNITPKLCSQINRIFRGSR